MISVLNRRKLQKLDDHLPWTPRAETPVLSIRLANSTVSWGEFNSRILQVIRMFKFLLNVVKIWKNK